MEMTRQQWAGVPFRNRYSEIRADLNLVQSLIKYDRQLDLKFYLPTEKWHLVRYLSNYRFGQWCRVWELDDKPEVGLRKEPGYWILDALRASDMRGAAENRVEEVDKANAQLEASIKREAEVQAKDVAEELRKPLIKLYEEGPTSDYKGVF